MENLITKNISYLGIRESFNEDAAKIQEFIKSISNQEIRERIIDEAREFFAEKFNVAKEDVWYGDLSFRDAQCINPFPFSHVIGHLDLASLSINMDKLVYVYNITSSGVADFPNLETITGFGKFHGSSIRTSYVRSLPKLKFAPYLYCNHSNLSNLGLEESIKVNLTCSKLKSFSLRVVEEELSVAFSPITDISSLERVGKLNCRNTNIELVNPRLEILGELHCENSNNFEAKITTKRTTTDLI